ncbi:MAG: hypothetical protein ACLT0Y_02560 [Christensenellales bacterium]
MRRSVLSVSYFAACTPSTLIVNFVAMGLCLAYLAITGWYLAVADVCLLALDVLLLTLFGVALSSCIHFLNTQARCPPWARWSAPDTAFCAGRYADFSFSAGLQRVMSFARHVRHRFIAQPRAGGGVSRNAGRGLSG